jgi:integrase
MRGHIRERSRGHWAIILDIRDPETGKRRRKWHSFRGTKRQAQDECARLIFEINGGTYLEPSKTTLAAYLDHWLSYIQSRVSPRTHERYAEICLKNIVPLLGAVPLTKLRPPQISAGWTKALQNGHRGKGKGNTGTGGPLSARTVHHMHTVLKSALGQAVRWEMLTRNPAEAVDPPKPRPTAMLTYDLPQTAELIDIARKTRMHIPVVLAVLCGMRRGEIAALRWGGVDLGKGQLAIVESAEQTKAGIRYKSPKSGKGRTVALSATVVDELRQHRLRQAQELLRLGVRQNDNTFVCGREDGEPLQPNSLTIYWARLVAATSLPRVRFHDLRHAHATHMLANGVHPKVASERLGHSKVGITLDLYSHVLPGMQEDAAAKVDAALQAAAQARRGDIR